MQKKRKIAVIVGELCTDISNRLGTFVESFANLMDEEQGGSRKRQRNAKLSMTRMIATTKVLMIIMQNVNLKKIVMAKTMTMMTPGRMKMMTTGKMKMTQMAGMTTIALVLGKMNSTKTQHSTCIRLQEDLLG
jgi:hypothetical protein